MASKEIQKNNENAESLRIVEKFLTQVWFHPLVDQTTLDKRQQALAAVAELFIQTGIDLDKTIGLLVGGVAFIARESSDYDFVVLTKGNTTENIWRVDEDRRTNVHIASVRRTRDTTPNYYSLPVLLLTPDMYVVGNKDLLHNLRLQSIQTIEEDTNIYEYWDGENSTMNQYFRQYYKKENSLKDERNKKAVRFREQLMLRSQQSMLPPDVWEKHFLHSFSQFNIPEFSHFKRAIVTNRGVLNIRQGYIANGVVD